MLCPTLARSVSGLLMGPSGKRRESYDSVIPRRDDGAGSPANLPRSSVLVMGFRVVFATRNDSESLRGDPADVDTHRKRGNRAYDIDNQLRPIRGRRFIDDR